MTEKSGRIHTSAVTVAVLPQADEVPFFSCSSVAFVCVCVWEGGRWLDSSDSKCGFGRDRKKSLKCGNSVPYRG